MGNWLDKTGLTQVKNKLTSKFATKVDKRPANVPEGKFLQINSEGEAVWGDPASPSAIAAATEQWLEDNVAGGSTIAINKTLTIADAAADAKAAGDLVIVGTTTPTAANEPTNKLFITDQGETEYTVPTMDEHNELKSAFNDAFDSVDECELINFVNGYLYNTSNEQITTPSVNASYRCGVINCEEGDQFSLNLQGGGSSALAWCFTNSQGEPVANGKSGTNAILNNEVIIAPANAKKLFVNDKRFEGASYKGMQIGKTVKKMDGIIADVMQKTTVHEPNGSYSNATSEANVRILNTVIPAYAYTELNIIGESGETGATTVYFFKKNDDNTFTVLGNVSFASLSIGNNHVDIPANVQNKDYYIGFYSNSNGIGYKTSGNVNSYVKIAYSDIGNEKISPSGNPSDINYNFTLSYTIIPNKQESKVGIIVDASGNGDYTTLIDALNNEPENTVIIVKPGVYNQDMTSCLTKRVIVIGTDRNQCIIRDTDGRYGHHPLYVSCGYFENLTVIAPYISGASQEIDNQTNGAYAVHIDTDGDYAVGKQLEFHHCNISSDFFPAIGVGLRKNMTLIIDDCLLVNGQIATRGNYTADGTLGALFFHDSNGEQGDQFIKVKDCVLKSKLKNAMCMRQSHGQDNRVYCDFINNVLYSDVGHYSDTVWFRGDPLDPQTGIFSIKLGFGNSIASLNNNT